MKNSHLWRPPGPKLEPHQVLFFHIVFHIGESKGKVCFTMESTVHKRKEFRTCNFQTVFLQETDSPAMGRSKPMPMQKNNLMQTLLRDNLLHRHGVDICI